MSHRDSTVSESSLWHASCRRLVSRRLVNTHFIIVFVLVHLLSISVLLVNDYYTISLLSPINVPCKYTYKDFTSVIATKSSLLNRRCSIIATDYLLLLRARPFKTMWSPKIHRASPPPPPLQTISDDCFLICYQKLKFSRYFIWNSLSMWTIKFNSANGLTERLFFFFFTFVFTANHPGFLVCGVMYFYFNSVKRLRNFLRFRIQ